MRAQGTDADALKLLDQVAAHYMDADNVHIEATATTTSHADLYDQSQTSTLSAYIAPGGRFRYSGRVWGGAGVIVSNGVEEWVFLSSFLQYAKEPAGTFFPGQNALAGDVRPIYEARGLIQNFNFLTSNVRTAHFAPDEDVTVGGRKVHCTVVSFGSADQTRQRPDETSETKVWIDAASLTLIKKVESSSRPLGFGNQVPPHAVKIDTVTSTLYTLTVFGFQPEADTFVFAAPLGAKEVSELPKAFPPPLSSSGKSGPTQAEKLAAEHVNTPFPEIVLVDAAGKSFPLSRYAGHPFLLDLWATWCGPCVLELPALNDIRRSTAQTDLKILGVDEDDVPGAPTDLLKRRGYDWEDVHYTHALTKALPSSGIPLIVLVDASGNIVYYHTGADDVKGLTAAIAKLGKPYETVSVEH